MNIMEAKALTGDDTRSRDELLVENAAFKKLIKELYAACDRYEDMLEKAEAV